MRWTSGFKISSCGNEPRTLSPRAYTTLTSCWFFVSLQFRPKKRLDLVTRMKMVWQNPDILVMVLFYWKPNRLICLITGNPMYKRLPEWKKKENKTDRIRVWFSRSITRERERGLHFLLPSRLFMLFSLGTAEFGVGCMYGFNSTTPQTKDLTNFVDEFSADGFNQINAEQQLPPGDLFSESWTVWLHVGEVQRTFGWGQGWRVYTSGVRTVPQHGVVSLVVFVAIFFLRSRPVQVPQKWRLFQVQKVKACWLLILWKQRGAWGRILKLLTWTLSVRRPTRQSVGSFLVNGCSFSCKEVFHPAPASTLAGIGYFALPVVGRHIFSGRADSGVPANAQQQSVTCFSTSPVRLAQLLSETKNCCNRRRHVYNNHNDKKLARGIPNWAFLNPLSTSAKSHSSSHGVFCCKVFSKYTAKKTPYKNEKRKHAKKFRRPSHGARQKTQSCQRLNFKKISKKRSQKQTMKFCFPLVSPWNGPWLLSSHFHDVPAFVILACPKVELR